MIQPDTTVRTFGRYPPIVDLPDLVEIQTKAWQEFLAAETAQVNRMTQGLEALLREVFPIYSYDKTMCLEYVGYELGRPRYSIDECRKLRLTFGYPCLYVGGNMISGNMMGGNIHVGLAAMGAAIGVGLIGMAASSAVGRNPGGATKILVQSILSIAFAEAIVFYALFLVKQ